MIDTLREARLREYRQLWRRVPGSVGSTLWMAAVVALGWQTGAWLGALAMVFLTVFCRVVPGTSRPAELIIDLAYATVLKMLVQRALWLLTIADLGLLQGHGLWSVPMVIGMFFGSLLIPFLAGRLLDMPRARAARAVG